MRTIQLTLGKEAVVDDADFEKIKHLSWCTAERKEENSVRYYSVARINGIVVLMHRYILGLPPRLPYVDHKDGDGLNCQRSNLRICDNSSNQANRRKTVGYSRFKGVSLGSDGMKWVAQTKYKQKQIYIGRFESEEDAARAYDKKMIELHGEFARVNFPGERCVGS